MTLRMEYLLFSCSKWNAWTGPENTQIKLTKSWGFSIERKLRFWLEWWLGRDYPGSASKCGPWEQPKGQRENSRSLRLRIDIKGQQPWWGVAKKYDYFQHLENFSCKVESNLKPHNCLDKSVYLFCLHMNNE